MDLLESVGFDIELAGAELLGGDVAKVCQPDALRRIRSIFRSGTDLERLISQMIRSASYVEAAPAVEQTVNAFSRGLLTDF